MNELLNEIEVSYDIASERVNIHIRGRSPITLDYEEFLVLSKKLFRASIELEKNFY